jgi:hypothetical protein
MTEDIRRIQHLERLNNSSNGNPRFRVYFTDGTSALTSSDAGVAYGIGNREMLNSALKVELTRAGRIAYLTPVTPPETVRTWADGFGTWHAVVERAGGFPDSEMTRVRNRARRAIRRELAARQAPGTLAPVRVKRVDRLGISSVEFVEAPTN